MHHLHTNYAKNTKIYQLTSTEMKTGKITGGLQKVVDSRNSNCFYTTL